MLGKTLRSTIDVITPSNVPNSESMPRVKSIRKKRMDHRGAQGNWLMASVKTMKARPVPEADCGRGGRRLEGGGGGRWGRLLGWGYLFFLL